MARQQQAQQNRPPQQQRKPPVMDLTLPAIAGEYGIDHQTWLALQNLYPGARDESIIMVNAYCKARGLDPLRKPVHIVPMSIENKKTGQWEMRDVVMQGIQELRTTAMRTGEYAGMDKVIFGQMTSVPITNNVNVKDPKPFECPEWAEITVYRLIQGKRYGFTHTEFFAEAVGRMREGLINAMWQKRPRGQLAKVAEAGALRKAFPEELGGVYAAEEMEGREESHGDIIEGTAVDVTKHGASGIPEPEAASSRDEDVVDAEFAEEEPPPDVAASAPRQEEVAKSEFKIDLPDGPRRVLDTQMKTAGVSENWLLTKLGASITVRNINDALAVLKAKRA